MMMLWISQRSEHPFRSKICLEIHFESTKLDGMQQIHIYACPFFSFNHQIELLILLLRQKYQYHENIHMLYLICTYTAVRILSISNILIVFCYFAKLVLINWITNRSFRSRASSVTTGSGITQSYHTEPRKTTNIFSKYFHKPSWLTLSGTPRGTATSVNTAHKRNDLNPIGMKNE